MLQQERFNEQRRGDSTGRSGSKAVPGVRPPSKSMVRRSGHGGEGRGRGGKPARQLSHTAVKPTEAK